MNKSIARTIFRRNSKILLRNWMLILFSTLFFVSTLVYGILFELFFKKDISSAMINSKNLLYIKMITDLLLITAINLSISSYLFKKQFDNGIQSIEKKMGVKKTFIFFIRYAILETYANAILVINFLLFISIVNLLDGIPYYLSLNKLLTPYMFYFVYGAFISFLINALYMSVKVIVATLSIYATTIFLALYPLLNSVQYKTTLDQRNMNRTEQDTAIFNAKAKMGLKFSEFIEKNNEYQFLFDEFPNLKINYDVEALRHWSRLYQRVFYFGDLQYEEYFEKLEKRTPNLFKLIKSIDDNLEVGEYMVKCNEYQLPFASKVYEDNKTRTYKNSCNIKDYTNYLIDKNIEKGKYNKLFKYIGSTYKNFASINNMDIDLATNAGSKGGVIFQYGHFDEVEVPARIARLTYKTPMQMLFNFYLLQSVMNSENIDYKSLNIIKRSYENTIKRNMKINNINIFHQFNIMWQGKDYFNPGYDDVFSTYGQGAWIISGLNNYYSIDLPKDVLDLDERDSDVSWRIANTNEMKRIITGYHEVSSYEAMIVMYFLAFKSLVYVNYLIYRRKWK